MHYAQWNKYSKKMQTNDTNTEAFDVFDDPHKQHDLYAILPEQTQKLQMRLHTCIQHVTVAATMEVESI